jgi:hypothetical protein
MMLGTTEYTQYVEELALTSRGHLKRGLRVFALSRDRMMVAISQALNFVSFQIWVVKANQQLRGGSRGGADQKIGFGHAAI